MLSSVIADLDRRYIINHAVWGGLQRHFITVPHLQICSILLGPIIATCLDINSSIRCQLTPIKFLTSWVLAVWFLYDYRNHSLPTPHLFICYFSHFFSGRWEDSTPVITCHDRNMEYERHSLVNDSVPSSLSFSFSYSCCRITFHPCLQFVFFYTLCEMPPSKSFTR